MTDIAYPFDIDATGQTALADTDRHLRDLVEQILFTTPGERVMRPTFGAGIAALVFAPVGNALAATLETSAHAALQQGLGQRAQVSGVDFTVADGTLQVVIRFHAAGNPEQSITVEVPT